MKLSVNQRFWIIKRRLQGASVVFICQHAKISRRTFYYYWRRFRHENWKGLGLKSHKPHTIHRTPQDTIDLILQLRKTHGWGPSRIEGYIRQQKPEGVNLVGHNTIYRVLCQTRLNKPLDEPRKTWGKRRFQRSKPNDLWQVDWKLTQDDKWMVTFLDDFSRFIPGSKIHENATAENTIDLFKKCVTEFGVPKQVLTDQGVQFHTAQEDGVTKFDRFCRRREIQHIVASKRRPTTIGKVERFHGSYESEAWRFSSHQDYIYYYNYERPHQALNYLTPADVYFKRV